MAYQHLEPFLNVMTDLKSSTLIAYLNDLDGILQMLAHN